MVKISDILEQDSIYALLEDSYSQAGNFLFTDPVGEIIAQCETQIASALARLDEYKNQGFYLCGYFSYEAGYFFIDQKLKSDFALKTPLLHFFAFKTLHRFSKQDMVEFLNSHHARDHQIGDHRLGKQSKFCIFNIQLSQTQEQYRLIFQQIKEHIRQGDLYQINYTLVYKFQFYGNILDFYQRLRSKQKVEFAGILQFPQKKIISLSPELFLRKTGNSLVSKPMKGTVKRSEHADEDAKNREFLQKDPKTLSENIMIVDLIRNDMGKICRTGSVQVDNLFQVQTFHTLHQMISTVSGKLEADITFYDILQALFPCGSVTGAPKIRAMEIIAQLETEARGVYTGAMGYILPDGDFCFNVPIRTIMIDHENHAEMGIGSGIVDESEVDAEFQECLLKANFLTSLNHNFHLLETLQYCAQNQEFLRLKQHLHRLSASADFFGFYYCDEKVHKALQACVENIMIRNHKIRLQFFHDGEVKLQAYALDEQPAVQVNRVLVSEMRVDHRCVFQYHKTSHRDLYETEYQKATDKGYYDVIFCNGNGEIAEASRHNIFVRYGEQWLTPPVSSGALPGVYREIFLQKNQALETMLTLQDLVDSDEIIVTNSVRGAVSVMLDSSVTDRNRE